MIKVITLGGYLLETKKKKCQTSGPKTGQDGLRNLSSGRLCQRALETAFD